MFSSIGTYEDEGIEIMQNPIIKDLIGKDPVVNWILPGFIPQGVLLAIAGSPGAGKSFLFYTIGLALASGIPILGTHPQRPYRVLYFDQENSTPDRVQYERWAWHGLHKPNLELLADNFWCAPFVLGGSMWEDSARIEINEHKPEFIVFDTATPCFHIQDENDNAEATKVIGAVRRLQGTTHPCATAIVLKHARLMPESGSYTLRGAKAWEGAVDGIIYVVNQEGKPRFDGLTNKRLIPAKTRAFGLRHYIDINASWTDNKEGISLAESRP